MGAFEDFERLARKEAHIDAIFDQYRPALSSTFDALLAGGLDLDAIRRGDISVVERNAALTSVQAAAATTGLPSFALGIGGEIGFGLVKGTGVQGFLVYGGKGFSRTFLSLGIGLSFGGSGNVYMGGMREPALVSGAVNTVQVSGHFGLGLGALFWWQSGSVFNPGNWGEFVGFQIGAGVGIGLMGNVSFLGGFFGPV